MKPGPGPADTQTVDSGLCGHQYGSYVCVLHTLSSHKMPLWWSQWSLRSDVPSIWDVHDTLSWQVAPEFTSYTFWQLKVLNFNICVHVFIINVAHWRCDTLPHVLTPRSPGVNNKWHTYLASHWSGPSNSASDWSRARPDLRSRTGPNGVPRPGPDLAPTRPEHEDRGKDRG